MTGNLVITGQTLFEVMGKGHTVRGHTHEDAAEAAYAVFYRCVIMLCNCLGAFVFCAWHRHYPQMSVCKAAPCIGLLVIVPDIVPFLDSWSDGHVHDIADHESVASMWSVCALAFGLGATHFLCSPANEGSRLKAVTMAATGHMHGVTKLLYRWCAGDKLKDADWEKMAQSINVTVSMAVGAVLGAAALHLNFVDALNLGFDGNDFLLFPAGITLVVALTVHDAAIEPSGGWPAPSKMDELRKPLNGAAAVDKV